jgi:putative protease
MGLQMCHDLGIKRVILPRETSISDLKKYIAPEAKRLGLELEMFIQGALCYSYSGLCLFSGLTLGTERSGNRGSCAQMCRSYYETSESNKSYPFSCHDMSAGSLIKELHSLGVISFKIEGRLKGAPYVAANLVYYRALLEGKNLNGVDENKCLNEIRLNFARKFSLGHLKGSYNKQELVNKNYPKNLGISLGKIHKFNPKENSVQIQVDALDKDNKVSLNKNDRLLILKSGFNEKGLGLSIREVKELKGKEAGQILCYLYSTDKEISHL